MLVQESIIGASGGCADTNEYYRSNREAVLVQNSSIAALVKLCWYSRLL